MFFVYILLSLKDGKHYIGSTQDIEKRLREHNSGKTISLRRRIPLKLIYKEEFITKPEATKREREIKSYKGGNAFKRLIMGL